MPRLPILLTTLLILLLAGVSLAFNYRVDSTGGPLTLAEDLEAAIAAWAETENVDFEATVTQDAATVIGYGQAALFGPDLYSLTLSHSSGAERELRVLLNPAPSELRPTVLLHEVGVLAGLPEAASGVMNPRLKEDSPTTLSEEDRLALQNLEVFAPEDINRDGVVDFYDLAEFARAFGRTGVNLPADLNQDGVVDRQDLELLRSAYTFGAPAEEPPARAQTEPGLEPGQAPAALPPVPGEPGTDPEDGTGLDEPGPGEEDPIGDPDEDDFDEDDGEDDGEDDFDGFGDE